jgi:hypothetical protein
MTANGSSNLRDESDRGSTANSFQTRRGTSPAYRPGEAQHFAALFDTGHGRSA